MNEDQLSANEKRLFDSLSRKAIPPKELENKIIKQLVANNQIKKNHLMNANIKWTVSMAASLLLFLSGWWFGNSFPNDQVTIEPSKGYMLILHEGKEFQSGEPMEMFTEYRDWMIDTFERGVKITGQELKTEATLVRKDQLVASMPENDDRTTGYFLLEANSLEEALEVAKANPHVKYGGTIEVKSFMVRK